MKVWLLKNVKLFSEYKKIATCVESFKQCFIKWNKHDDKAVLMHEPGIKIDYKPWNDV